MWTLDQRQRMVVEHQVLQREGFDQFSVYHNRSTDSYYASGTATANRVLTKCFREPRKLVGVIEDMRKTLCFRSFFSPTARR